MPFCNKRFRISKNSFVLIISIIFIILLTGVSTPIPKYQREVNINYQFSMKLLRVLNRKASKNIYLVSPLGIMNNLAILYAGSTGKAQRQIAELLMTSNKPLDLLNQQQKRMNSLVKAGEKNKATFEYANILLADNTYCKFQKSFRNNISTSKFCKLEMVEYKNRENTINRINEWCKERTHNRIKIIITPEDIRSKSSLEITDEPFFTLLSAIYFKGNWSSRFDENTNNKFPFYYKVDAPGEMIYMMEQNNSELEYAESSNIRILKMYFEGNDFSLVVVLPKKIMSAEHLLAEISPEEIKTTSNYLSPHSVNIKMPKFEIKNKIELKSIMKDLGFTDMSNFASIFEQTSVANSVYINAIKQKNYFTVDEKGAKATSVTSVQSYSIGCAMAESYPSVEFMMDRPFLYFLQHEKHDSGIVLFAGCYAKPQTCK